MSPFSSVEETHSLPQDRGMEKKLTLKMLREHEGKVENLMLSEFTEIEDAAARDLPRHFHSSVKITDASGEERFAPGRPIFLTGLKALSLAAAIGLSQHEGYLMLNGLITISDRAAKYLGRHEGALHLEGLNSLSETAAEYLGKHEGYLGLGGLTEISTRIAGAFIETKGSLYLAGLTHITDEVAGMLWHHVGTLFLNADVTMSDNAREVFVTHHEGPVILGGRDLKSTKFKNASLLENEKPFPPIPGFPVG